MNKVTKFISEVKLELTKVSWPKKDEVIKLTVIVLLVTLIVGLYTGGLDYIFTKALGLFIR